MHEKPLQRFIILKCWVHPQNKCAILCLTTIYIDNVSNHSDHPVHDNLREGLRLKERKRLPREVQVTRLALEHRTKAVSI